MRLPRPVGRLPPGPLGVLAVLAVPVLGAGLLHLALGVYGPAFAAPDARVADFSFYYDGAVRFAADPAALYAEALARPSTGFTYPPAAVVPFLPLTALPLPAAFLLMGLVTAALAVGAALLTLRLHETATGVRPPAGARAPLALLALATAPVLQNLRFGQVNVLVLVLGLLFLHLLVHGRPGAAAFVLSLGFWLKLYPLALALLGFRRGQAARLVAGFALGLVGVPVLLAPLVPLDLYGQYATALLPTQLSATVTDALNQSLPAVTERLRGTPAAFFRFDLVPVHPAVKAVQAAVALGLVGGLYAAAFGGRLRREVAGVGLLAVLPVISGLGWEHTYVLALPLVLVALVEASRRGRRAQGATAAAVLLFLVPKPPRIVMEALLEGAPRVLSDVLYARFPLAVLVLLGLVVAWTWEGGQEAGSTLLRVGEGEAGGEVVAPGSAHG